MSKILEYMQIPSVGGSRPHVAISPDNEWILFSSNESQKLNLYVQSTRNPAEVKRITPAEQMVYIGEFSPDGKSTCYLLDENGTEKHDLLLVALNEPDAAPRKLTKRTLNTYPDAISWHPSGREIARGFIDGENSGLEIINIETGEVTIMIENLPPLMTVAYSHNGEWLACTAYANASYVLLVNRNDPTQTKIIRLSEDSFNASPSWSGDDARVGFITKINGFAQPVIYDLKTDEHTFIELGEGEESIAYSQTAQEIAFHPDGETLYYAVDKNGRKSVFEHSLKTGERKELPFPAGKVEPFRLSADGGYVAAVHSSIKSPAMVYWYATQTGEVSRLTANPHKEKLDLLPAPQMVFIESFDGRKIHNWYIPAVREDGQPGPAVVIPHGGPSTNSGDSWFEGLYYQAFALSGISVIVPNYRGSTGFGDEFYKLNVGDVGGGDLGDVAASAKWLQTQKEIDPSRIGVLGASYGGYLSLMAMAQHSDLFAVGISIVPAVDWAYQYSVSDKKFQNYIKYLFDGAPDEKADLYRERSLPAHAEGIRKPLMVIAGANDYRCPLKPIQDLEKALDESGVPHQFIIKGLDGHMSLFDNVEEQIKDLFAMLAFLQENL
jgi:dipeptidyl aminopeptidase/acylaminoacyl peptidase